MGQVEDVRVERKVQEQEREEAAEDEGDHVAAAEVGQPRLGRLVGRADAVDGAEDDGLDAGRVVEGPGSRPAVGVDVVEDAGRRHRRDGTARRCVVVAPEIASKIASVSTKRPSWMTPSKAV